MITEYGMRLYQIAVEMIEKSDSVFTAMNDLSSLQTGRIKVGIPPIIGTCLFPNLIAGFIETYPGIEMVIDQHGAHSLQQLVDKSKLDVAFTIMPTISDAFDVIPIVEDKNMLIVSRQHTFAKLGKVKYNQLKNEKFVLLDEEYTLFNNIIAGCRDAGFEPRVAVKASQWDFVTQLVKANMGISILPRQIIAMYPEPSIVQLEIDHPSGRWDVVMISKMERYETAAVRRFKEYIKEHAKKL